MRRMTLGALVAASALTLAACADDGGGDAASPGAIESPPIEEPLDASPAVDLSPAAVTPAADVESPAAEEATPAAEEPAEETPAAEASPAA